MAKPLARTINRIVDRTSNLVYVVDMESQIAFANQALSDWTGLEIDDIRGSVLSTQSAQSALAGLAFPPELLGWTSQALAVGGDPNVATKFWIWRTKENSTETLFCPAVAQLVFESGEPVGVLVIGQPDLETDILPALPESTIDVSAILAKSRNEMRAHFSIDSLVGQSEFSRRVRKQVEVAAKAEVSVLFTGPVGSGKEHLARALYEACYDDDGPTLTPIHCSIADPQLVQQAISDAKEFDHRYREREIVLLLLDVDRLDASSQAELLGFLSLPNFPIRTFATANTSLLDLANQGDYLADLAYRLSPFVIETLELKGRRGDVPVLAQAILERYNVRAKRLPGKRSRFSEKAVGCLVEFDWPGNLNQLREVVESAAENCSGAVVTENDLPDSFRQAVDAMRIGRPEALCLDLEEYLASIEKELIVRAIRQGKGNKTQAAKQLNVSRPKLLRRLQFFELTEFLSPTTGKLENQTIDSSAFEELDE